jgi:hypothetical protein
MADLPFPPTATFLANDSASIKSMAVLDLGKWRRVVGLLLLALTIFLWTATNFLASVR